MARRNQPPLNPLFPVLVVLVAVVGLGLLYWAFGIGKGALDWALAGLLVFGTPVVVVFGITGVVLGIRRLLRRSA